MHNDHNKSNDSSNSISTYSNRHSIVAASARPHCRAPTRDDANGLPRASAPRACRREASKRSRGSAQASQLGERGERRRHRPADRVVPQSPAKPAAKVVAVRNARTHRNPVGSSVKCVCINADEGMGELNLLKLANPPLN